MKIYMFFIFVSVHFKIILARTKVVGIVAINFGSMNTAVQNRHENSLAVLPPTQEKYNVRAQEVQCIFCCFSIRLPVQALIQRLFCSPWAIPADHERLKTLRSSTYQVAVHRREHIQISSADSANKDRPRKSRVRNYGEYFLCGDIKMARLGYKTVTVNIKFHKNVTLQNIIIKVP